MSFINTAASPGQISNAQNASEDKNMSTSAYFSNLEIIAMYEIRDHSLFFFLCFKIQFSINIRLK